LKIKTSTTQYYKLEKKQNKQLEQGAIMSDNKYDNTLSLWKNAKRREGKQDPQYTGSGMIEGKKWSISGWINTAKKNEKAPDISIKVNPFKESTKDKMPF
jgi:hypothetical protein